MVSLRKPADSDLTALVRRRDALKVLLIDGWRRIDAAVVVGRDVSDWEQRWMRLLGEYEAICDAIKATS